MKKIFSIAALALVLLAYGVSEVRAQAAIVDSLTTIDPELRKYFPRWRVCEPDLQYQIYQAFAFLGFPRQDLSMQDIEVLAAPRGSGDRFYDILMITSGKASLNSRQLDNNLRTLADYLSGRRIYDRAKAGDREELGNRTYCYNEIPAEMPINETQAEAIMDFLGEPTNVDQAIVLSLFEQAVKLGESGFWLRNEIGNDMSGYPFWTAGESRTVLKRPLYVNNDTRTNQSIPYLINAYLGGAYRMSSGVDPSGTIFSWVQSRRLNTGPGLKLIGGLDIHMPFRPEFGLHFDAEVPLTDPEGKTIDPRTYASYQRGLINVGDTEAEAIVPILMATGDVTLFYNLWINRETNPENYFRFDLGINYTEVREYARYRNEENIVELTRDAIDRETELPALRLYKPNEFLDWIYFKTEYRNQAVFPFSASVQISNQILLTRLYLPLLGNWLFIEGKYATPIRGTRPYEIDHFFMISPVLRLTI